MIKNRCMFMEVKKKSMSVLRVLHNFQVVSHHRPSTADDAWVGVGSGPRVQEERGKDAGDPHSLYPQRDHHCKYTTVLMLARGG